MKELPIPVIDVPSEKVEATGRVRLPALTIIGGLIVLAWALVAIFAPLLTPYNPIATDLSAILQPPSAEHPLGTDNLGHDMLSQIIYGTRTDLSMGLIGVAAPFIIGLIIGLIGGYFGGVIDVLLMRLLDIALAFPFIVLVLAIVAILGPGLKNYYIALAIVAWVPYARLVRAETLVMRNLEFIEAARVLGYNPGYIAIRHVLPNAVTPAVVFLMTDIVLTVLLGSGLSFFGLGAQPPTPEWGRLIAQGQTYLNTAWWISIFPGIAIVLLALGFSLLGDGLAKQLRIRG